MHVIIAILNYIFFHLQARYPIRYISIMFSELIIKYSHIDKFTSWVCYYPLKNEGLKISLLNISYTKQNKYNI